MEVLKSPLFLICSILFLIHQLIQYGLKIHISFVDAYLDNVVAMPILLTLLLFERKYLLKRDLYIPLSFLEIILAAIYVSVVSEWIFPLLSSRFTFDPFDFVFFFAGTGLYLLLEYKKRDGIR